MLANAFKHIVDWLKFGLFFVLLPFLILVVPFLFVLYLVNSVGLRIVIWWRWCRRGKDVLFVYSDSPNWHEYINQSILPYLGDRAIVLNWSERKKWPRSLAEAAFSHFGGDRDFNPLAVVFRPFGRTRTFRFRKPFRGLKHGHPEALQAMENEFFACIGIQRQDAPT
jgi:hypothetical protein